MAHLNGWRSKEGRRDNSSQSVTTSCGFPSAFPKNLSLNRVVTHSALRGSDNSTTRHSLKSSCRNVELSKCRAVGSTTCRVGMEFKPRRTTSCCVCRGTPAVHEEVGRCVGETLLLTWTSLESPSSKAATESSESCVAVWYESPVRRWTDGVLGALICTNEYKRHVCPGSCAEITVYKQGKLKYIRTFSCSNASPI